LDFTEANPEDKLKSLDDSVDQIDLLTKNFAKATAEEESSHNDLALKLKDVIANKGDPHQLLAELSKSQNETLDIDEMLHKGHINQKYAQLAQKNSDISSSKLNKSNKLNVIDQNNSNINIPKNNLLSSNNSNDVNNKNKDNVNNNYKENLKNDKNSISAISKVSTINNQNILKKYNSVVNQTIKIDTPPIMQDDTYRSNPKQNNIS